MKKFLVLLILLPAISRAQVDAAIQKKLDSVKQLANTYTDSRLKAMPVTISVSRAAIDSINNAIVPLYEKRVTTRSNAFINIDTLRIPVNTAYKFDLDIMAKNQGVLQVGGAKMFLLIANINGVYKIKQQANYVGFSGDTGSGGWVAVESTSGVVVIIRPPTVATDWTLNYTKTQI